MLKVEIDQQQSQSVEVRSGNKNGRNWEMKSQPIWLYKPGQKHPIEINFVLPEGVNGYPAGLYSLDVETAIDQGNFKSLMLDTRKLTLQPTK